jgi:hypothetical protein
MTAPGGHGNVKLTAIGGVVVLLGLGALFQVFRFTTGKVGEPHWRNEPVTPLYPRLTCAEGEAALAEAARTGVPGERFVLRPTELTIHARAPGGQDHAIECDGIRLPVVDARQGDPSGAIRYRTGPHAVFVRAEPIGRLTVFTYCGKCNVVGAERMQRRF